MSAKSDQIAKIMAIIAQQHETVMQLSKQMDIASAESTIKLVEDEPAPAPATLFDPPIGEPGITSIDEAEAEAEAEAEQAAEIANESAKANDQADPIVAIVKSVIEEMAKEDPTIIASTEPEYEDDSDDEPEATTFMPASAPSPARRADEDDESANIWAAILGDRYIRALLSYDDVEFAKQHSNLIEMAWGHTESSYSLYAMEEYSISMLIKYARGMYESAGAAKLQFPMLSKDARVNVAMRGAFTGALMSIL